MTEKAWQALNGEIVAAPLDTAAMLLTKPVQISFQAQRFMIMPFDLWKEKVKLRQQKEK
ncbi:MAG: hypothetical protein JSW07_21855 [bacterium]|nr:MAG: hypothetical protein JSW07_21855 [bacterium]